MTVVFIGSLLSLILVRKIFTFVHSV